MGNYWCTIMSIIFIVLTICEQSSLLTDGHSHWCVIRHHQLFIRVHITSGAISTYAYCILDLIITLVMYQASGCADLHYIVRLLRLVNLCHLTHHTYIVLMGDMHRGVYVPIFPLGCLIYCALFSICDYVCFPLCPKDLRCLAHCCHIYYVL